MRCRSLFAGLVVALTFGCSGKKFKAGPEDGGAGTGTGGMSPTGGAAGNGGMAAGGNAGTAGNAGAGGTGGTPCTCAPTTYCRNGDCLPCSELSMLEFGEPELLLDHPSASVRFPRAGDAPDSLFYRIGTDGAGQLWYTPGTGQLGALVGDPAALDQSAPLFVGDLDPRFNLIFDETEAGERHVRGANWNGNVLGAEVAMPSPLSPGGWDDYSPAAAIATRRFYWMSTRDGPVTLRTGVIGTGEGITVTVEIPKRVGTGTCPLAIEDATPWVTPDGRRLFLRAYPLDDQCQPREATATDLFVVPLEMTSGMPTQPALQLASVSAVGSTETDPSLSPDLCTLYFASDVGSTGSADFKLFRASRR